MVAMAADARLSVRDVAGAVLTFDDVACSDLARVVAGSPWRVFRWRQGQAHYSGWYWSATMAGHVVYESRLELSRLLLADFDPSVVGIAAQPFCLAAQVGDRVRRHVPDFLLVDAAGLVTVVNVKPAEQLARPKVAEALGWAGRVFTEAGWRHEIWSGAPAVVLGNVRFLAAYRRADRVDAEAVNEIDRMVTGTARLGEVEAALAGRFAVEVCRPALLHLVWRGVFRVGLDTPLSSASIVERAA
ncbi:TnsA-like heteromeric transposase endonuclease subunit [Pseudofrankia sp. BMG5.37]|uniref:TnsA-like heteromeric transposase endonuclease subunit n=1 Tax=Pseudofrankia sp. BMG5.37 TaxID=3050035 RepID=UPI00289385DB|nr:TnsA-like heteromeric transposase endonuclease subunit [Pseudofrankia sp. BMG5.37]MDT3446421.1 TnsA-like heteromeric transposase endonuclease subunit [Pseudofrankia sp. BMG5.37]